MREIKIPAPSEQDVRWTFSHLEVVDSTNRVVADLAKQGLPEGQVILADHQSAGRGRLDRDWLDTPGSSVLMSILLRPKFSPQFFFLITSSLSLAALRVLESKFSIRCQLKWPNDVMVADKKIAGVLAEAAPDAQQRFWVVAGIGLNCLQSREDFSALGNATSVFAETGAKLDQGQRIELAEEVVTAFGSLYLSLGDEVGRIALTRLYRSSCDTIGKLVMVDLVGKTMIGTAVDVSVEGNLIVETESGLEEVSAGDVVHLRKRS